MTPRSGSRCAQGVIALLALVLAACGNNGNPSDSENAPTGPSDSASSSTSPASGTDKVQALKLGSDHREVLAEGRYAVEILYPGPEWQDEVENTGKFGGRLPVAGETASLRYQVDVPDKWEAVDGRGFDAGRPVLAAGDGGNGTLSVLLAELLVSHPPVRSQHLGLPPCLRASPGRQLCTPSRTSRRQPTGADQGWRRGRAVHDDHSPRGRGPQRLPWRSDAPVRHRQRRHLRHGLGDG